VYVLLKLTKGMKKAIYLVAEINSNSSTYPVTKEARQNRKDHIIWRFLVICDCRSDRWL